MTVLNCVRIESLSKLVLTISREIGSVWEDDDGVLVEESLDAVQMEERISD